MARIKKTAAPYHVDENTVTKPGHPRVVLRFAAVDGRQTLVNVEIGCDVGLRLRQEGEHIEEPQPLPASKTRLPLQRWVSEVLHERLAFAQRLAAGDVLRDPKVVEAAQRTFVPQAREDLRAGKRRRPRLAQDHLEAVARVYAEALEAGLPPTKTVAATFYASRSAAAKWVARARAADPPLLGPTEKRKAGGVLPPKRTRRTRS